MKAIIVVLSLLVASIAQAEVFYDINFHDTLGEVKNKYPGAIFKKMKPAWLKPKEALVEMSGQGIPNKINIHLIQESKNFGLRYIPMDEMGLNKDSAVAVETLSQKIARETLIKFASPSEREEYYNSALLVYSVEIVYSHPVPKERFLRRYGSPDYCRLDVEFDEICYFKGESMYAVLSKNGDRVLSATTNFTWNDKVRAYMGRGEPVPKWLEEIRY